jgi:hypothetical protein
MEEVTTGSTKLTNYGGSGLQVVTPDPPDAGGVAINANFKSLATNIAAANPAAYDDSTRLEPDA